MVTRLQMPGFWRCAYGLVREAYFVAENLDLAGGSVDELVGSRADVVGVDL